MVVYKITNNKNGKIYIGQTTGSIKSRWSKHCSPLSHCVKLKNAIQKYGKDSFSIEIIKECSSKDELNKLEKSLICKYNSIENGYNLTTGGDAFNHNEETKRKIRNFRIGYKFSKEAKENMSKSASGRSMGEEQKKKISRSLKGSEPVNKGKGKLVRCLNNNKLYSCASEAARELNLRSTCVNGVASGRRRAIRGYRFIYE